MKSLTLVFFLCDLIICDFRTILYIIHDMTWQRFAKDRTGSIVDIYNVSDAYVQEHGNDSFTCLECGNPMLTKRGKIKEWHFAHVGGKNVVCSYESYLHKLGIIKFIETYKKRMDAHEPFYVEIAKGTICRRGECPYGKKVVCGNIEGYESAALLPYFGKIEREVRDGDFIPDILLTANNGMKIYIEIVVSHFSEPRKIASGVSIVEIELKSESDFSLFTEGCLSERNESIRMFNFSRYRTKVDYGCERKLQEAKAAFINRYRACVRNGYPLNLVHTIQIMCSREDCPYIEGHCCSDPECINYDVAKLCKEVPFDSEDGVFTPDFYLETKKEGEKIRFNFCYKLFSNADKFGDVRTVQFTFDTECGADPWLARNIWDSDSETRFFNFLTHKQKDLCENGLRLFDFIVCEKNGYVRRFGVCRIDQIHQEISKNWDNVDDYILIPVAYGQSVPFYDNKYLKSLFEKSCNACLHCLDKKFGADHILSCELYKRGCNNEEALKCPNFKRNLKVRYGKMGDYAYSYKYRGSERIIEAWRRYRLKRG